MSEHPPSYLLEELAAGAGDDDTAKHVEGCDACRVYVERLSQAAIRFAQQDMSPAAFAEQVPTRSRANRRRTWAVGAAALSLAAAAAVVFLLLRPAESTTGPIAMSTSHGDAAEPGPIRFKGSPQLAVIRQRDGDQQRLTVDVGIRPYDRLRAEIAVDMAGTWEVGVLSQEGAWVTLMPPTMLSPGTHITPQAVRFDDAPSEGWLIAGPPDAVMRARTERDFEGVTMIPLRVEKER